MIPDTSAAIRRVADLEAENERLRGYLGVFRQITRGEGLNLTAAYLGGPRPRRQVPGTGGRRDRRTERWRRSRGWSVRRQPSDREVRAMACPKCGALPHEPREGRGMNGHRLHAQRRDSAEDALNRYEAPATSFVSPSSGGLGGYGFSGGRRVLPAKGCE